jgi:glycosyltransferase involved in cell wall biosynthesis
MLSVICPIYNEEKYIAQFLDSLLIQDYPKDNLEILLVDGMSKDSTREVVSEYIAKYPFIRLIDNPDKIVPYAMNRGIDAAKGDIIMRLDAHASYQPDYFSVLVNGLKRLHADNVGTVCKTDVLNKTPKTLSIREVLCNKFGVGNSTFRTGIDHEQEVETVPFGCWTREVFEKYGKYDVRLVRNQDIELNKRILRGGGKIYILPDTYCTYLARETWHALAKNNYGNGKWNILTVYYTKMFSSLSLRHFIPLLFLLSLIVPVFLAFIWWPFALVSLASLLAYTGLLSFISAKLAVQKHLNFFYLLATFFVLHLSYGWGSLMGILELPFTKS